MKLFILGDSHTRSFMNIKNILPFFLGSGQKFNLNNNSYNNIISSINRFFDEYNDKISINDLFFLYFGEPNCRYLVDDNYYPFKKNMDLWSNYTNNKDKLNILNKLITNYDKVIDTIDKYTKNYYIITPTTGFYPTLYYMDYFNKLLKEKYETKLINLYDDITINNSVDEHYLNENIQYDPIHLNSNISDLFLDILKNKNIINDKNIFIKDDGTNGIFKRHNKFNTYVI